MNSLAGFLRENARWVAGGFLLTFFSSYGQTFFISLSAGHIRAEYGLSHGGFGALYMVATLASALTLPQIGKLVDRWSVVQTVWLTVAMLALACISMALSASIVMLAVTIYFLRLFGQGMMTHTSQTLIGRWFVATRGRALAISGFGFPASEAAYPLIVVALLAFLGWREIWMVVAGVLMLVSAPGLWWLLRENRTPQHARTNGGAHAAAEQRQWTRKQVLRDPIFYLLMPAFLAPSFIGTGIFFHQVHMTETKGWELVQFAGYFPLFAATQVVTALVAGFLVDRWSARHILPLVLVPQGIAAALLASTANPLVVPFVMMGLGLTSGLMSTVSGALWPEIYGVLHLGAIRAMAISAMVLSTAAAPFVLGVLIDAGVAFDLQLYGMACYMAAATVLLIAMSRRLLARELT